MTDFVTQRIAVCINCKPLPKGRPRVVNGRAHTDAKTRAYETMLRANFAAAAHFDKWTIPSGDVVVDIVLRFGSAVHGDVDNCAKAILDAAQGVLMANDKCVRSLYIEREWATAERPEGITVTVTSSPMEPRPKKPKVKRAAAREEKPR